MVACLLPENKLISDVRLLMAMGSVAPLLLQAGTAMVNPRNGRFPSGSTIARCIHKQRRYGALNRLRSSITGIPIGTTCRYLWAY